MNALILRIHSIIVVSEFIYIEPQPPPSLANDTFSLWSEQEQCLMCNEIYKEEPLGMPVMQQQVPVLSENHTLAFIDCIMACMKMVSHKHKSNVKIQPEQDNSHGAHIDAHPFTHTQILRWFST